MPSGLMNEHATFQRMMDSLFRGKPYVKCYVDDVVVHSRDREDHIRQFCDAFDILGKSGLRVRLKLCFLIQPRVELACHFVDAEGVHVDDSKIERIRDASRPIKRKELGSFVGLASYDRRFIKVFAKIVKPLQENTSDALTFEWTDKMQKALDRLKQSLCSSPVLKYPGSVKPFNVHTDAPSKAIRSVLSQKDDDGREDPIHYTRRCLSMAEKNY